MMASLDGVVAGLVFFFFNCGCPGQLTRTSTNQ
jgi:hypothetical protein